MHTISIIILLRKIINYNYENALVARKPILKRMASLLLKENNHYPVLVQLRGCLAWEEQMIFFLSPCYPFGDGKWLCLQSPLQNYFEGDRSTFYKIQLGWQGRQGKQIHTKWKWLHGWNVLNARQSSISNCTHPDDHIIQSCAKSKSLLHILLWVSKSFSQLQRAIISKHGTS